MMSKTDLMCKFAKLKADLDSKLFSWVREPIFTMKIFLKMHFSWKKLSIFLLNPLIASIKHASQQGA